MSEGFEYVVWFKDANTLGWSHRGVFYVEADALREADLLRNAGFEVDIQKIGYANDNVEVSNDVG